MGATDCEAVRRVVESPGSKPRLALSVTAYCAMATKLIPPFNFGYVEEDLYRCGLPIELNFPFLEKLRLKTIIFLASEPPSQQFVNFVEDQEIELESLEIGSRGTSTKPISEETILRG